MLQLSLLFSLPVKAGTNEDSFEKFLDGSQSDGSEESMELILEEVESSTSHLQESEIFIPKQRRGRRRKKKKVMCPKQKLFYKVCLYVCLFD